MVKILSVTGICFLLLAVTTHVYYKQLNYNSVCRHRIITSNSFHTGVAEVFKEKYKDKYDCEVYFAVVNGANLISNLFNKQPGQYDVLIGLDSFQIKKINNNLISAMPQDLISDIPSYEKSFFVYDESPLTFFLRNSKEKQFKSLKDFIQYADSESLTIAIPLGTTSVIGALFETWAKKEGLFNDEILTSQNMKFVKSWSEGFGLFERKIVDGFLSFETSEIYFLNSSDVSKIFIDDGHPNLQEYFAFSSQSKMTEEQKKEMVNFIYSEDIQSLLLKENFMWPVKLKNHEYSELRTLKKIEDSGL